MKISLDGLMHRHVPETVWQVIPDARLVGGAVRDLILGRASADIDMASPYPPEEVACLFEEKGFSVIPTGLAHGTVTVMVDGHPCEITTLRRDVQTDGRHARVAWTDDWAEDAARRDFTFNALSCDRSGRVYDYFGGCSDLEAGIVRFAGDPAKRIEEDALRILRFFRFFGRFGRQAPDTATLSALRNGAGLLKNLSPERVWSEMKKILSGPQTARGVGMMAETGVLHAGFPEISVGGNRGTDLMNRALACGIPDDPVLRFALLTIPSGAVIAERLRLSREEARRVIQLPQTPALHPGSSRTDIIRALADYPLLALTDRSWLAQAESGGDQDRGWDNLRERISALPVPVFPLAGRDLVAAGVPPGPEIGQILLRVRGWWLEEGCVPDREACLTFLRQMITA
ncbi:CCA tRNA nucleotidyltransferase [Acetobacter sp. AN02]|uniref:CCA tRNA nucleotidyltransferase n=1 Tax=Acetobacter sp. AN02 TaxID=2894186 RepID=UPI00243429E1|nr:CCA tRNA nucleotidyltransferase [Acetobacter sp. AN02]MDG6094432.1 CCA tRNA nucleotidyltransferase [Acetobacter sp. AN02]